MLERHRPFAAADYAQLKSATRRAVSLAGPLDRIARKQTRLDAATISRAGNPEASNFLPLDVALDLDALAGDDVILRMMARLRGYDLVPIGRRAQQENLIKAAGDVAKESGELVHETINAAADGDVTPSEAKTIDAEAAQVEGIVACIRRHVHGVRAAK